ncbi:MAG: hypothetical protein H7A46_15625 [Verrucomicrobiales bacterium]|nr:hypothetical protein [Verrucomicrobiales bacterium]
MPMIELVIVPIAVTLCLCAIQRFATRRKERPGIYRTTLSIWALVAAVWLFGATMMPDGFFAFVASVPEAPDAVAEGVEVFLCWSVFFAPIYLVSSSVLLFVTIRARRNRSEHL